MGKVYDALRRAESQRSQRAVRAPELAPPIQQPLEDRDASGHGAHRSNPIARLFKRSTRRGGEAEDANTINKRRITLLQPDSFVAEQFRSLRARLDSLAAERPMRTIAITSALPGEGKTTAAVNLAVVTAMKVGRRILLIDCDLRKPKVHTVLNLRPEAGLAEVLTDEASLDQAVVKAEGVNLEVLPVRGTPSNPSELLASERMRSLLEEVAASYDQVILDTPPTLSLPDAKTLSELTDGLVLVVRAGKTPQDDVQAALDVLDRRRVLGIVLNATDVQAERYAY